jgi:hypothetical protein
MGAAFASAIALQESALLAELFASGATSLVRADVPGAVTKVERVNTSDLAANSLTVELEGTAAAVTLPSTLVQDTGEGDGLILLMTAFELSEQNGTLGSRSTDSQGVAVEGTLGLVSVKLSTLSDPETPLSISGLRDPIQIQLNTNASSGLECAYWDDDQLVWATDGMEFLRGTETTPLVCASYHLTIFSALLRGILMAFVCSQANLVSEEWLGFPKRPAALLELDLLAVYHVHPGLVPGPPLGSPWTPDRRALLAGVRGRRGSDRGG